LWLGHLARVIISQTQYYQNLIRNPAHIKLELDAFIFRLPLNRTFPRRFGRYGYSRLRAHLSSLPENEIRIAADVSLSVLDSVRKLLKFLYMAV
jgi:hypothetical protein